MRAPLVSVGPPFPHFPIAGDGVVMRVVWCQDCDRAVVVPNGSTRKRCIPCMHARNEHPGWGVPHEPSMFPVFGDINT